jgi:hypothetical protein
MLLYFLLLLAVFFGLLNTTSRYFKWKFDSKMQNLGKSFFATRNFKFLFFVVAIVSIRVTNLIINILVNVL